MVLNRVNLTPASAARHPFRPNHRGLTAHRDVVLSVLHHLEPGCPPSAARRSHGWQRHGKAPASSAPRPAPKSAPLAAPRLTSRLIRPACDPESRPGTARRSRRARGRVSPAPPSVREYTAAIAANVRPLSRWPGRTVRGRRPSDRAGDRQTVTQDTGKAWPDSESGDPRQGHASRARASATESARVGFQRVEPSRRPWG